MRKGGLKERECGKCTEAKDGGEARCKDEREAEIRKIMKKWSKKKVDKGRGAAHCGDVCHRYSLFGSVSGRRQAPERFIMITWW